MKTRLRKPPGRAVRRSLHFVAMAAGLAGCAIGPDYQRPAMELPSVLATAPAGTGAEAPSKSWWTVFNDPVLNRLVDEAQAHNLDLIVAAARVSEAQGLLGLAVSDQTPVVYAAASRTGNRNSGASDNSGPGQPLQSTTNRATLNVSFELDFWGKYRRATEAVRAELMSIQANRDALRLSLTAQVAQGYFNLRALDARMAVTAQAIGRGNEALAMQKKRFDAGVISEFDYQQRFAEVDAGRAQMPPLLSQRNNQERALGVLLGRSPRDIIAGKVERAPADATGAPVIGRIATPAGLPSDLLLRRPDIMEAEQKLVAANARIGVARAAYFPSISLTGLLGSESSSLGELFSGPARIWNFAGNLTQPLWGAGRIGRQVEVAEARKEQAVAQYKRAIANAFREMQDAIQAQTAARDVLAIEERRVASLAKSTDLARLRYENGVASQLDVIDAERSLLLAELNRIEAERALQVSIADLYKALGGG